MSETLVLPVSIDQLSHGHERRQSRQHQRQGRLAPPFQLPRIPSGATLPPEQLLSATEPTQYQYNQHQHSRNSSVASFHSFHSANSSDELTVPLFVQKRSFEARNTPAGTAMSSQHRHVSRPTDALLHATEKYSLLHGILADPESRRMFYFMLLNLAFMGVQSTYGFLTGSLGLISDSIHMFFDCVALLVGVCAAVMSKWPPTSKFPYGYGKIDTLAGLGNGIFLMLISVEIVYEAVERLFVGSHLERTTELLFVSIAGLAVNMVGIFAFHGHHGHDHRHDHSHGENMQGIYLHIMADALGSVAVVISTLLVQFTGWNGWDPLASCMIAVLIFISVIPLVASTIKILLLSLDSDVEYSLRDILGNITSIRGVVGYTVPKFWLEDLKKDPHDHGHHGNSHDHAHDHSHEHDHHHDHHGHAHPQPHAHQHNHAKCSDSHGHDHHDHSHDHNEEHSHSQKPKVLGTMHVQISQYADIRDVQSRVSEFLRSRNMDIVIQYEREGDNKCWCLAGRIQTPLTGGMKTPITGSFSQGYPSGFMAHQQTGSGGNGSPLKESATLKRL